MISYKKIFKTFVLLLFLGYLVLFFSYKNGYYEDVNAKKVRLTGDKIKQFEEDIKKGKKVDVNDYTVEVIKNYDNKVSKFGSITSKLMANSFKWSINKLFSGIDKMMETE